LCARRASPHLETRITWGGLVTLRISPANSLNSLSNPTSNITRMATRIATYLLSTTPRHSLSLLHTRFVRPQLSPRKGPISLRRSIHTALLPPLVFAQLLLALWAYKVRLIKQMRVNICAVLYVDNLPKQVNISPVHTSGRSEGRNPRL
jgi:hypothetical protein